MEKPSVQFKEKSTKKMKEIVNSIYNLEQVLAG